MTANHTNLPEVFSAKTSRERSDLILPHLMPFDGKNPHSVVILDNCSIHHYEVAIQMIRKVGAIVHFLPPYTHQTLAR